MIGKKVSKKPSEKPSVGFIQLVYFGDSSGEVLTLGGAGFITKSEFNAAWAALPSAIDESDFMADRMDAQCDIVDVRRVSKSTVESLLGKPLAALVKAAKSRLAKEKADYAAVAA
jgi:hypothetical protein